MIPPLNPRRLALFAQDVCETYTPAEVDGFIRDLMAVGQPRLERRPGLQLIDGSARRSFVRRP